MALQLARFTVSGAARARGDGDFYGAGGGPGLGASRRCYRSCSAHQHQYEKAPHIEEYSFPFRGKGTLEAEQKVGMGVGFNVY